VYDLIQKGKYLMNGFAVSWVAVFLLVLTGCYKETPGNTDKMKAPVSFESEITLEGELPSVLTEGLTPEEKSRLTEEILPNASPDDPTREEKFLKLRKDADAGDVKAQNILGLMYFTGEVISKDASGKILSNDASTAAAWFHRAALQGYAEAQFNLGLMYANGEGGLAKDTAKAVEFFRKAAIQGNADAQNNLGAMYYLGEGVPKNNAKAVEWYTKAAAQGNADAQANLDTMK
jgi:TPR repeat protein